MPLEYNQNYYKNIWKKILNKYSINSPVTDLGDLTRASTLEELLVEFIDKKNTEDKLEFLDVGPGNWLYLRVILETITKLNKITLLEGMDHSLEAMKFGIAKYSKFINPKTTIKLNQGEISKKLNEKIPQTINCIICLETLEHLKDDRTVFLKLLELLKTDGILILSVPNRKPFFLSKNWFEYIFFRKKFSQKDLIVGHYRRYVPSEFLKTLPPNFKILKKYNYGFFVSDYFKLILALIKNERKQLQMSKLLNLIIKIENRIFNFFGINSSEGFFLVIKKYG